MIVKFRNSYKKLPKMDENASAKTRNNIYSSEIYNHDLDFHNYVSEYDDHLKKTR